MRHFKLSGTKRSRNKVNGSDRSIETLKASTKIHKFVPEKYEKCHPAELVSDSWSAYKTSCKYLTSMTPPIIGAALWGKRCLWYKMNQVEIVIVNVQGCTNRCSLAAGLRGNEERMRKWRGNGEEMEREWGNGGRMRKSTENEEMERGWGNQQRMRKWKEDEEIGRGMRKWTENEEMERDFLSIKQFPLFALKLLYYYIEICNFLSQKSVYTQYALWLWAKMFDFFALCAKSAF